MPNRISTKTLTNFQCFHVFVNEFSSIKSINRWCFEAGGMFFIQIFSIFFLLLVFIRCVHAVYMNVSFSCWYLRLKEKRVKWIRLLNLIVEILIINKLLKNLAVNLVFIAIGRFIYILDFWWGIFRVFYIINYILLGSFGPFYSISEYFEYILGYFSSIGLLFK